MYLKRVIICEKSKDVLDDLSLALHNAFPDCDLITTDSGYQCIKIAQEMCPDIFILGLNIHDMCGFQLIRTVRQFSDNYIIVLSNTGEDYELVRTMKEGADRYIKKPVRNIELIIRIKALLFN